MRSYELKKSRAILLLIHYFVGYCGIYPYLLQKGVTFFNIKDITTYGIYSGCFYLTFLLVTIIIAMPLLSRAINAAKKKPLKIIATDFKNMGLLYLTNIALVMILFIVFKIQDITSTNQTEVVEAINQLPVIYVSVALIFAPIVEECVFRGVIYRKLRDHSNFVVSAIIASFLFGFLHIYQEIFAGNFADLISLPVYFIESFYICRAYEKEDNIVAAIGLHFLLNAVAIVIGLLF